MLSVVFTRPNRWRFFWKHTFLEIEQIGINSLPIVALMSTFMGAVIALQTASSMESPLLPDYTVGFITQSSTILEFSPTIISLILAGKVGSNVASEIGTMRVTEQIDALEIMGVIMRAQSSVLLFVQASAKIPPPLVVRRFNACVIFPSNVFSVWVPASCSASGCSVCSSICRARARPRCTARHATVPRRWSPMPPAT